MNTAALCLAAELGGAVLNAPGAPLLLVERIAAHGAPQVLILGLEPAHLRIPLDAWNQDLAMNLLALLPLPGCDLGSALALHKRRLGALVCALDASIPWLEASPMLAKRLPGRVFMLRPQKLEKAPQSPLEKAELKSFLPGWSKAQRKATFRRGPWREIEGGWETELWPGVERPPGAVVHVPPLELPSATPLCDVLRAALRSATGQPIPLLPCPGDPSGLHALKALSPHVAAFDGPKEAWIQAFRRLASLPAPPHFCARC